MLTILGSRCGQNPLGQMGAGVGPLASPPPPRVVSAVGALSPELPQQGIPLPLDFLGFPEFLHRYLYNGTAVDAAIVLISTAQADKAPSPHLHPAQGIDQFLVFHGLNFLPLCTGLF